MLLVPMLITLLVVLVLLALLLLWYKRRRTGTLTLRRGGKRNGRVSAWAGPTPFPDDRAPTVSELWGHMDSEVPKSESYRQRPSFTTFLDRQKSHQSSVVLKEVKPVSGPNLKGEEEPLMASKAEAVENPTSDQPTRQR
ncbi:mCG21310 [Mus musculus]|jgi:sialophorin|nr:mCG21310 [Mus musculus]